MKERLTGAAVLVILGVILIPLLLDGPDPDVAPGPVADPGRHIVEIMRGADKPAGPGSAVQADSDAEPDAAPAVRTPPPAEEATSPTPAAPASTRARSAQTPARSEAPPTAAATPKPATPAPEPAVKPAAKPTPKPARPDAVPPPSAAGGWAIQIGSFGSRENADRLKRELDGQGYPVFLMPVQSGGRTLHRVRVGPYSDRATADQVARRLAAAGPGGTVVRHGG